MLTRFNRSHMGAALFAAALLLSPLGRASAQGAPASRWDAFIGCWAPAQAPMGTAAASLLCIVPSAGTSAADLVTISHGKEIGREHVEATNSVINKTRDGCTGWERGTWSDDAERLYITANYTCPDGRHQVASGLIGMTANGELLNVQGLDAGKNKGVRVTAYVSYDQTDSLPADIAAAVQTPSMSVNAARVAASAPLRTQDVIEASHHLDAPVVEAWLANHGDQVSVDADQLVEMANGGVPGDVTDVMVALSNPDKFQINPALGGAAGANPNAYGSQISTGRLNGVANADTDRARGPLCPYSAYGWDYSNRCYYASSYGFSAFDPYWMYRGYYPYGYSPYFGYGYGYGYGGGYGGGWYGGGWYGGTPVVVVTTPDQNSGYTHGRVVKGRGYVSGTPRSGGTSSGQSAPSSSSGSAGSSSAGSTGSSSAGSTQRTAHKRGGGGI